MAAGGSGGCAAVDTGAGAAGTGGGRAAAFVIVGEGDGLKDEPTIVAAEHDTIFLAGDLIGIVDERARPVVTVCAAFGKPHLQSPKRAAVMSMR